MEENPDIAVCRLYSCDYNDVLKPTKKYKDFHIAGSDVGCRLETQVALWNRETLMSFIDLTENPWQFEAAGTERIKNTDKLFLWHHVENSGKIEDMIFPYSYLPKYGYGVWGGCWLWNNKKWLKQNGITGVPYYRLGNISEKAVQRRYRHLYNANPSTLERLIRPIWKLGIRMRRVRSNIFIFGLFGRLKHAKKQK